MAVFQRFRVTVVNHLRLEQSFNRTATDDVVQYIYDNNINIGEMPTRSMFA